MFSVDIRGYRNFADDAKAAARRVNWATAYFLTELADKHRTAAIEEVMPRAMVIRDKGFLRRRMGLETAKGRSPVASQVARFGSTAHARFSGWREQIEGGSRERVGMTKARTGRTIKGKMAKRFRLNAPMPSDRAAIVANAKSPAHRSVAFLAMMARGKMGKPFLLLDHPTLSQGVWSLKGKRKPRLEQLQEFGANSAIQRVNWMGDTIALVARRLNTWGLWERCWKKANVTRKKS